MPVLQRHHIRHLPYGTVVRVIHKEQAYGFARSDMFWWVHTQDPKFGLSNHDLEKLTDMGRVWIPNLPSLPLQVLIDLTDQPLPAEWVAYSSPVCVRRGRPREETDE